MVSFLFCIFLCGGFGMWIEWHIVKNNVLDQECENEAGQFEHSYSCHGRTRTRAPQVTSSIY